MPDHDELIAKLEAATMGSRELSDDVLFACGWGVERGKFDDYWSDPSGKLWRHEATRPDPTTSFDAVMGLARNAREFMFMLNAAFRAADYIESNEPVNPWPSIRAALIVALKARGKET